jgi:hypothetical protein
MRRTAVSVAFAALLALAAALAPGAGLHTTPVAQGASPVRPEAEGTAELIPPALAAQSLAAAPPPEGAAGPRGAEGSAGAPSHARGLAESLGRASHPAAPLVSTLYLVSFGETDLPAGVAWSVTLAGQTGSAVAPNAINFSIANGTWTFTVGPVPTYSPSTTFGNVTVDGGPVSPVVVFYANLGPAKAPTVLLEVTVYLLALLVLGLVALLLWERGRRPSVPIRPVDEAPAAPEAEVDGGVAPQDPPR